VAARLAVASAEVPKLLAEEEVRQANAPTTRQVKGIFGWINTPCSFAAVARLPSMHIRRVTQGGRQGCSLPLESGPACGAPAAPAFCVGHLDPPPLAALAPQDAARAKGKEVPAVCLLALTVCRGQWDANGIPTELPCLSLCQAG
jgi:hypothetical protein